jgi:hypothetical protein
MKNLKYFTPYLIFLLLFEVGCTDNEIKPEKETKNFIEVIDVQKDKELLGLIGELYNKRNNPSGRTLNTSFGEINLGKALKLNDTIFNRTRYTLGLIPTGNDFIFENVIISVREEGVFHYILQYAPEKEWLLKNPNNPDWSKFTGKITQLDFDRNIVAEAQVTNGVSIEKKNSGGRTSECYDCTWEIKYSTATGLPYLDIDCGAGGQYTVFLRTKGCEGGGDGGGTSAGSGGSTGGGTGGSGDGGWGDGSGGGDGTASGTEGDGGYSNPIGILLQYKVCPGDDAQVPLDYPCPGEETTNDESAINTWEDYQIFDSQLKPCMQPILTDIKNLSQGSVGKIIKTFIGSVPGYNWELKDGVLPVFENANTSTIFNTSTGTVTTVFDASKFKDATNLSIARTILHESIHAYVVAVTYNNITDPAKRALLLGPDWGTVYLNFGHDYITNNYLIPLASSLEEYGNSMLGYTHSTQFYQDLAWGGLTHYKDASGNYVETPLFLQLVPSATDRARINNTISIELTGKDTSGTPKTQKGLKAGC